MRRVEKPWGEELIWAETERYAGKILRVRAGCRLSLQLHRWKDESLYLARGRMVLELVDERGTERRCLEPGATARIRPGQIHRFEAIEDCEILEVSTPELDDVVRLSDDWGRAGIAEGQGEQAGDVVQPAKIAPRGEEAGRNTEDTAGMGAAEPGTLEGTPAGTPSGGRG